MTRGSHSSLVACLCELSPLFPLRLWKGQRPQPWAGDHPLVLSWQGPWGVEQTVSKPRPWRWLSGPGDLSRPSNPVTWTDPAFPPPTKDILLFKM